MACNLLLVRVPVRRQRFGFLSGVCDNALWALLNTPPGGMLRVRPDFPEPAALATGANPAVRDAFKRAMEIRAAWLACSASLCLAILDSIGEASRLAISDPLTDTLHLCVSPRDIIIAMNVLHGTMTGAEVDALRLPLKKNLSAVSNLHSHIVAYFRGVLARFATAGQAPLELDAFRLFLATLSSFPMFHQYTLLFMWHTGQLPNKRLRLTLLTSSRNCTKSSPTSTPDLSRVTSKGLGKEQARMM